MSGRRASDWLSFTPRRAEEDARGAERRQNERRAPQHKIDPLFVAALINQVAPNAPAPSCFVDAAYRAGPRLDRPRPGAFANAFL